MFWNFLIFKFHFSSCKYWRFYLYNNKDLEIFKRFFKEQVYQWEYYPVTNDSIQHLHYALQQFAPFLPELIVQAA